MSGVTITYPALVYQGKPGDENELTAMDRTPLQVMFIDFPLQPGQLPGTRVIFTQDGRRWIKTAQAVVDGEFVLFVRLAVGLEEEKAWARHCDSDLCEVAESSHACGETIPTGKSGIMFAPLGDPRMN